MELIFHKSFRKDLTKCTPKLQQQTRERIALFINEPRHKLLRLHSLKGEYAGMSSLNINADVRVVFYLSHNKTEIHLIRIGTHSQLYG